MKRSLSFAAAVLGLAAVGCATEIGEDFDQTEDALSAGEIGPDPKGSRARYPILVTLGAGNTPNHWPIYGVVEALRADGHTVAESVVPVHSTEVRAFFVGKAIDTLLGACAKVPGCDASRVNIIAYSQGGLDARAVAHNPAYSGKIASISLVGTPHRGSSVADAILTGSKPAREAAKWLVDQWTDTYTEPGFPKQDAFAAWEALAAKNAAKFNSTHPDVPGIYYQSWAGVSEPGGKQSEIERIAAETACEGKMIRAAGGRPDWIDARMVAAHAILKGLSQESNDGLVTVRSAKWTNFRGCLPADHQDFLGRVADNNRDRRTGFNHVRFYRNMAFELSARGL